MSSFFYINCHSTFPTRNSFSRMHGTHFLNEEYEISASRLTKNSKQKTAESFNRLGSEQEIKQFSSTNNNVRLWQLLKDLVKIIFALSLLIKGLLKSLGTSNTVRLSAATQLAASYVTPKFLMFKRSPVLRRTGPKSSPSSSSDSQIIEILPVPLHLIIALSGLDGAKKIMKKDPAAQLIAPTNDRYSKYNSTTLGKIHLDTNSTTIFEALAFSWCESFKKNRVYPTKLIITGPAKISSCVMGRYRWALKIPKKIVSFREVNGTEPSPNFFDCSKDHHDPFDCSAKGREEIRFKYSETCPDMAPIFLACNNRIMLERALAYKPKWADIKKLK